MNRKIVKVVSVLISLLMLSSIFSGFTNVMASKSKSAGDLKPVTLKFYFGGDKRVETDAVWQAIADKYKDKLNCTFDVNFIPFADYAQKINVMAASGDNWDMNFEGNWLSYPQMINKGGYLDLTTLLPKYAPDLYATYKKQGTLAAATVNGRIMGLPWTMKMSQRTFFAWRKDLTDKEGLKLSPSSIKTVEDMDKALRAIKKANPTSKILEVANADIFFAKYEMGTSLDNNYVFSLNDKTCKVIPTEQTAAFKDKAEYAKKWQDAGIIWKDVLVDKTDHNQMIDQGTLITFCPSHEWANATRGGWTTHPDFKLASALLYPNNKFANRSALANLVAINKNAANPERVLMFLNLLETDKALYDLVQYGILGKTYVLNGDKADYPEGMNGANSNYMEWGGQWGLWKPQFMRPNPTYSAGFWNREAQFASQPINVTSPLDGFFFDTTKVRNEISQRQQIFFDANRMIEVGLVKNADAAVKDLIAKEKAAGVDKITAELQKQVNAFLAAKKK
jgi:putative aldouronate transport system substrate-binding protein